jgi:hypothetical protein
MRQSQGAGPNAGARLTVPIARLSMTILLAHSVRGS